MRAFFHLLFFSRIGGLTQLELICVSTWTQNITYNIYLFIHMVWICNFMWSEKFMTDFGNSSLIYKNGQFKYILSKYMPRQKRSLQINETNVVLSSQFNFTSQNTCKVVLNFLSLSLATYVHVWKCPPTPNIDDVDIC